MDIVIKNEERSDMDKLKQLIQSVPVNSIPLITAFIEGVRFCQTEVPGEKSA
ncbi:MAG: hypothetical protein LKK00_01750 [Intestinimonas sp.]|jgi:hypothetical protein|nr:hypothetical protein [Intestinimonas sp.]